MVPKVSIAFARALTAVLALVVSVACFAQGVPSLGARAWILVDATSGTQLASHASTARLEPASLAKLMTAYVVFTAIGEKRIALADKVEVSAAAFAAPGRDGARMFIEPGRAVTVDDLIKGMFVTSGNDAAIALAEHAAGTVPAFVQRMNEEVRRLELVDTRFANPTGLSDSQQYSSAADIARLAQRLLNDFPQFADIYRVREFTHNGITQSNRNRLLWSDPTVDGMKTGHLAAAGWSIVATATRMRGLGASAFPRRLIAVVLGAPSDSARVQDALRLLNYGYTDFDTLRLFRRGEVLLRPEIWKGDRTQVAIGPDHDVYVTAPVVDLRPLTNASFQSAIERPDPLLAPLQQGETVGRLKIRLGDRPVAEVPIVALEAVAPAGLLRRAYDAVRLWWRRT